MPEDLSHILIFRTNIQSEEDKLKVRNLLASHALIHESSVDIEDVDKVLRVVSPQLKPADVITLVKENGFICEELE